jgi:hypothetical protein
MKTFAGNPRRGSSLVEFALCFTPVFFIILAVFEISRCMWTYETLSYSVTEATRLAIVHGENCGAAPNSCTITVAAIAQRIAASSQGLQPDQMTVGLASSGGGGDRQLQSFILLFGKHGSLAGISRKYKILGAYRQRHLSFSVDNRDFISGLSGG